jgi:CBS domain-containing protein
MVPATRSKRVVRIAEIMTRHVETVKPQQPLKVALKKMVERDIGSVMVIDKGRPVGIITERDISRAAAKGPERLDTEVAKVMSRPLIVTSPSTTNHEALRIILEKSIRRLPVVDRDKLLGIVTERNLLRCILATYELSIPSELYECLRVT